MGCGLRLTWSAYRLTSRAMRTASQVAGRRQASVTLQLIEGILAAAAAAGVADATRVASLRAGVAARSGGVQQSRRVPESVLLWLWGALVDLSGSPRVGAELARIVSRDAIGSGEPHPYGLLDEVATGAASLVDAFEHVARFVRLVHQGVRIEIDTDERCFTLTYRRAGGDANAASPGLAAGILWANANLALLPERAFGVRLRPASSELACAVIDDETGVIADIFGTDVTFGAADWRLVFDRSAVLAISRPIVSSTLAYLDAYADGALSHLPAVEDIVGLVSAEVRRRLTGGPPTVAGIAKSLGFSTRTLQRRLAVTGRTFAMVLDQVRRGRAEELLAGGRDLAAIAHELGYSEHSAFTRAAVRWFHAPPSRIR
jgi:AraC-like DNA-binding protein